MAQLAKVTRTLVSTMLLVCVASCGTTTSDENSIELGYQDYDDGRVYVEIDLNNPWESRRKYGMTSFTEEEDSEGARTFVLQVMSADDAGKGNIRFKCAVFPSDESVGLVFEINDDEEQLLPSVNEVLYKFDGVGWEDGGYRPVELEMHQDARAEYWATRDWTVSVMDQFFESDVLWIKYQDRLRGNDYTIRQFNIFMGDARERVNAGLTSKYTTMLKQVIIGEIIPGLIRRIKRSGSLGEYELTRQEAEGRLAVLGVDASAIAPREVRDFQTYARERDLREIDQSTYVDWERNVREPAYIDAVGDLSLDTTVEDLLDVLYADVGGAEAAIAALAEDVRSFQQNPDIATDSIKDLYLKGFASYPRLFPRQMRNREHIEAARHSIETALAAMPEACEREFR